jgi:aspartyl/asparaginyl beta-hydroxylase (cupin superfamily)
MDARMLFTIAVIRPAKLAMERAIRALGPAGTKTFFDPSDFPWIKELEHEFAVMRAELDAVLEAPVPEFSKLSPVQGAIVQGGGWKSFFLCLTRRPIAENCARCPETARLLRRIPGLENAFFSVLEGGTHLAPHKGPYGGLLRFHLALRVPGDARACRIRVGSDVRHWREGESLVFDDSHEHEAWNDARDRRVVLFVDFARPLPPTMAWANRWLLRLVAQAAFIEEIRANLLEVSASRLRPPCEEASSV